MGEPLNGFQVNLALASMKAESATLQFKALAPAMIRAGVKKTTDEMGRLAIGDIIEVLN